MIKSILRTASLLIVFFVTGFAQERVTFDANVLNQGAIERGDAGLNLCWL